MMKVGTGSHTYELVENFAKLPDGETFGLISRVTTDSRNRLYVFQRKYPAVLVFGHEGAFLHSWGSGQFKRAHASAAFFGAYSGALRSASTSCIRQPSGSRKLTVMRPVALT